MLWLYVSAFHKCERERAQIHTFKTKQQRKKLVHLSLDITWHRLIYVANWNIWCVFHMNSPAKIKKPKTTSDETIDSSTKNIPFDLTHMLHFCVFGFFVSVPVLQCAYFNFSHWYVYTRLTHTFNWCVYDQRYCFFFQFHLRAVFLLFSVLFIEITFSLRNVCIEHTIDCMYLYR